MADMFSLPGPLEMKEREGFRTIVTQHLSLAVTVLKIVWRLQSIHILVGGHVDLPKQPPFCIPQASAIPLYSSPLSCLKAHLILLCPSGKLKINQSTFSMTHREGKQGLLCQAQNYALWLCSSHPYTLSSSILCFNPLRDWIFILQRKRSLPHSFRWV